MGGTLLGVGFVYLFIYLLPLTRLRKSGLSVFWGRICQSDVNKVMVVFHFFPA